MFEWILWRFVFISFLVKHKYFQNTLIYTKLFANSLEDKVSIPGQVIPKTQKMILDISLLNTLHYMLPIKGYVE